MKKLLFLILSIFLTTNLKSFVVELNDQETINLHEESFLENQLEELPATILEAATIEITPEEEGRMDIENQNNSNPDSDSGNYDTVINEDGIETHIPHLNL